MRPAAVRRYTSERLVAAAGSRWLPGAVLALGMAMTLQLWASLRDDERRLIGDVASLQASGASRTAKAALQAYADNLAGIAARIGGGLREPRWPIEIKGMRAVLWAEPSGRVGWVRPLEVHQDLVGADLTADPADRAALLEAGRTGRPARGRWATSSNGGWGFRLVVPVRESGRLAGFLVGVFTADTLYPVMLQAGAAPGWALGFFASERELYRRDFAPQGWLAESGVAGDASWRVRVGPTQQGLARLRSRVPWIALCAGPLIAVLLSASLRLAQTAGRRARETEAARAGLAESEERLRLALAAAKQGLYDLDIQTGEAVISLEYAAMLGHAPGEFAYSHEGWIQKLHPEDRERVAAAYEACIAGSVPEYRVEFREQARDGAWKWILSQGRVVSWDERGRPLRMLGTRTDVSEQKAAEAERREAALRLQAAVQAANVGLWDWDLRTNRVYYSPEWKRQIGYAEHEVSNDFGEWQSRVHPDDLEPTLQAVRAFIAASAPSYNVEFRFRHKDGSYRWILAQAALQRDGGGAPVRMQGSHVDVTDHKLAQAERARLASAIEQTSDAVIMTDADGNIEYVNPAFEAVTGYTSQEVRGRNPSLLKSGEQDAAFYRLMWSALKAGETWRGRFVNRRKDGTRLVEEAAIFPVRDAGGATVSYVAVKRDISEELRQAEERQRLQAELLQAQKMESVGRLAGGVAHDFNNMLNVIVGRAELLLARNGPSGRDRHDLGEILDAARRSSELTRQLLGFARKQAIQPRSLDLNAAVSSMLGLLRRLIGEDFELVFRPGDTLSTVELDPAQLDQMLANLTVNARDATDGGGRITIETRNAVVDEAACAQRPGLALGDYALLSVSDAGRGMDEETRSRVFEPFFTTKAEGRGTGLGLATVYGIVKQNGGWIEVDSAVGRGSTFRIYLPRGADLVAAKAAEVEVAAARGGGETLLMVEDETALLTLGKEVLEELGYVVLAAGTPAEAVRLASQHPAPIALLLSDVVMPEMNGVELAERLRGLQPGLKCLFMSGYTKDVIARQGVIEEGIRLLEKPFTAQQLSDKIREVIDA